MISLLDIENINCCDKLFEASPVSSITYLKEHDLKFVEKEKSEVKEKIQDRM